MVINVDCRRGQEIDLVALLQQLAAFDALIHSVMRIGEVKTAHQLQAEAAAQVPGIAALEAKSIEVSLYTMVARVAEHPEIEQLKVGQVIVHIERVETVEISLPWSTGRPLACRGHE